MTHASEHHQEELYDKTVFGFWVYLITDFVLFAVLFAVYLVLKDQTFGGPGPKELYDIDYSLIQTVLLLLSATFAGFAGAYTHRESRGGSIFFFLLTFLSGIAFVGMEFGEYARFLSEGHSWQKSAFLSAYYTLLATHLLHVLFALLWTLLLTFPVLKQGITPVYRTRLTCLRMFWQFLNVVWVFIFSIVYLLGVS